MGDAIILTAIAISPLLINFISGYLPNNFSLNCVMGLQSNCSLCGNSYQQATYITSQNASWFHTLIASHCVNKFFRNKTVTKLFQSKDIIVRSLCKYPTLQLIIFCMFILVLRIPFRDGAPLQWLNFIFCFFSFAATWLDRDYQRLSKMKGLMVLTAMFLMVQAMPKSMPELLHPTDVSISFLQTRANDPSKFLVTSSRGLVKKLQRN